MLLSAIVAAGLVWLAIRELPLGAAMATGAVILLAATSLLSWTLVQMGDAFTVKAEPKGLVTTGPYARIRHPMYVFLDVGLLGAVLVSGHAYWLIPWVLLALVQIWRARREEALLEEAFGDAYRRYKAGTWF
jgi:protein-S-isoprenylcysteine O-methyltransferase Ste14